MGEFLPTLRAVRDQIASASDMSEVFACVELFAFRANGRKRETILRRTAESLAARFGVKVASAFVDAVRAQWGEAIKDRDAVDLTRAAINAAVQARRLPQFYGQTCYVRDENGATRCADSGKRHEIGTTTRDYRVDTLREIRPMLASMGVDCVGGPIKVGRALDRIRLYLARVFNGADKVPVWAWNAALDAVKAGNPGDLRVHETARKSLHGPTVDADELKATRELRARVEARWLAGAARRKVEDPTDDD